MKRNYKLFFAAFALLAAACAVDESGIATGSVDDSQEESVSLESCYEQGVTVVKFSEEMAALISDDLRTGSIMTKSEELNGFVQKYGITSIERVFSDDERWLERQHRAGLHQWYRLTYDPLLVTATKAANDLAEVPGVEVAEPSPKVKPIADYYNDTYYSQQWHLNGTYDINVEDVWENYTKGSSNVIVNVVDGGVDPSHPDLKDNVIPGGAGGSYNFVNNNYVITAESHGTHVGGIISAISNNGVGVAGIAGGDYAAGIAGVQLLSSQVFVDDVQASNFADGIRYGADNGALISQNSWGYSYDTESQARTSETPQVIKTAIDYFTEYAGCDNSGNQLSTSLMKGGIVIFAAGNDGWQYGHPADYEGCIAVGSVDKNGGRSSFSNYGDWVDICAPGGDIYSTYYESGLSTYAVLSGTSMACPMVSGVAALVVSYCGGGGFTSEDLWECLIEGADPDKVLARNIGPYLDAMGAVTYLSIEPPLPIDSYTTSVSANAITFTWNVPAGDETGTSPAYGMLLCASTNKSSIDGLNPRDVGDDVVYTYVLTKDMEVGEEASGILFVDEFNTTYYVTCVPYNYGSKYADAAGTKTVTTTGNNPPTITPEADIDNLEVSAAQTVRIAFEIVDPDSHSVSVQYTPASIADTWASQGNGRYTLTIKGNAQDANGNYVEQKSYDSKITATDSYGEQSELAVHFTIVENRAPYVGKKIESVILTTSGSSREAEIDLEGCFIDPDDDDLTYTVENTSSSTVNAVVNTVMDTFSGDTTVTTKLYLTARKVGTANITVIVTDAVGERASQTITVPVRDADDPVMAYPNPVTDYLYLSTDTYDLVSTDVKISSSTGSVVLSGTYEASAFEPAKVDVTSIAPGTYSVRVKYGTTDITKSIVKK